MVLMQGKPSLAASGGSAPCISITSPGQDDCLPGPDVVIRFETSGLQLCPSGCNIHFKLDNEPFEVQFDPSHPHVFRDVKPGTHTARVYAANHRHEAIPGTMDMVTFSVIYPTEDNRPEPGVPLLTWNLPQGEYKGLDAADIAADFLVTDGALSKHGYRVQVYVDGRRDIVYDNAPRHYKDLAPGFHVIRMDLVDRQGHLVPGPFNTVSNTILLSPEKQLSRTKPGTKPPRQAVVDSIHGAMTNGMPWVMTEDERPGSRGKERKSVTVEDEDRDTISVAPEREASEEKARKTGDQLEEIPGVHVGPKSSSTEPSEVEAPESQPEDKATEQVTPAPEKETRSTSRTRTLNRKQPSISAEPSVVTLQAIQVTSASTVMRAKPAVVIPTPVVIQPAPVPQLQMVVPTPAAVVTTTTAVTKSKVLGSAEQALSPEEINPMLPKPTAEEEK
jgi:hypothetical protein